MTFDFLRIDFFLWLTWGAYWIIQSKKANQSKSEEAHASRLTHLALMAFAFFLIFSSSIRSPFLNQRFYSENPAIEFVGALLTLLGLGFAVWARNHLGQYWSGKITLKEGHRLIRTGPYRLARHPIYTGFFIAMLGSALSLGKFRGAFAVVIALSSHWMKIKKEESTLISQFGDEYLQYQSSVKTLIPYIL